MLIDTHAHIYTTDFDRDRGEVIERALQHEVQYILMPAIDKNDYNLVINTAQQYPKICLPMMGLYPDSVNEHWEKDVQMVYEFLQQKKFIAVGEIGLDFLHDTTYKEQQLKAFDLQLKYALEFDLPVSVHSRNAMTELLPIIAQNQNGKLRGVQHCFSGTLHEAQQLIELGFYLGIGGRVTRKNAGILEILQEIGLNRIVLETDAPYVPSKQHSGKRNEPSFMVDVVDFLSQKMDISKNEIATLTTQNAEKIFNITKYFSLLDI